MILLIGIPSETPMRMVREQLDRLGGNYLMFNQRHFASADLWFEVRDGVVDGEFRLHGHRYPLAGFKAVYTRAMDDGALPECKDLAPTDPQRLHARGLHDALMRWSEVAPALVINRCRPMGSNSSKPYQAQLIARHGFLTPPTLVSSDPDQVRAFLAQHGRLIYKSASAARSIVETLSESDLARLDAIRWCPTQFQAFVEGTNLRVHVVGDRVYPTAIASEAVDYRYAARQSGTPAELREVELADDLAQQCIDLARSLGLSFAGIDLKITPDDQVYCFEVNPSPAFSYYEANTGQPISEGLARCLMEADGKAHDQTDGQAEATRDGPANELNEPPPPRAGATAQPGEIKAAS